MLSIFEACLNLQDFRSVAPPLLPLYSEADVIEPTADAVELPTDVVESAQFPATLSLML
jgi:hypothetical protein